MLQSDSFSAKTHDDRRGRRRAQRALDCFERSRTGYRIYLDAGHNAGTPRDSSAQLAPCGERLVIVAEQENHEANRVSFDTNSRLDDSLWQR